MSVESETAQPSEEQKKDRTQAQLSVAFFEIAEKDVFNLKPLVDTWPFDTVNNTSPYMSAFFQVASLRFRVRQTAQQASGFFLLTWLLFFSGRCSE